MSSDTKDQLARGARNNNKELKGTENALDETGLYIISAHHSTDIFTKSKTK